MSQELLKIFRVQELFDMSRTALSFGRLLLSVSVREDLQILPLSYDVNHGSQREQEKS